jgi:hypothetical protein
MLVVAVVVACERGLGLMWVWVLFVAMCEGFGIAARRALDMGFL